MITPTTTTSSQNRIDIDANVLLSFEGEFIEVKLRVQCVGQVAVFVTVTQQAPETTAPGSAGTGDNDVVCDGQTHEVGVNVMSVNNNFDLGRACAAAAFQAMMATSVQQCAPNAFTPTPVAVREVQIVHR